MTEENQKIVAIGRVEIEKVKNYITECRKKGKQTLNITEASQELNLTYTQVMRAYELLLESGYFEEEEWEIEILAFIKGKEQAKAAVCEVHAALLNYPLTYIDTKLTKPELQKALEVHSAPLEDIEKAIGEKERVVWADYDLARIDHQELLADILKSNKVVRVEFPSPAIIKVWWIESE